MVSAGFTLEQAYSQCRELTREKAKNFYYAFIVLPKPKRSAIYAVYCFCRLCDDAVDEPSLLAEEKQKRLTDIRHSLNNLKEAASQQPLFAALSDTISKYNIPLDYFQEIVNGVEMDLTTHRYATFEQLRVYCYRVASAIGLICVEIYGYKEQVVREYAVDLGIAMQLTNIIRDVQEDMERNRIYIPLEEFQRFGYSEEALAKGTVDEAFRNLMRFQAERARNYFQSGLRLLPHLSPRSRTSPALLAAIYQKILKRIETRGFNVFEGRASLSSREKYVLTVWTCLKCLMPVRM
jgi:phytoene synthase